MSILIKDMAFPESGVVHLAVDISKLDKPYAIQYEPHDYDDKVTVVGAYELVELNTPLTYCGKVIGYVTSEAERDLILELTGVRTVDAVIEEEE